MESAPQMDVIPNIIIHADMANNAITPIKTLLLNIIEILPLFLMRLVSTCEYKNGV